MDHGAESYLRFLAGDDNGMVELIRDYKDGLMLYLNGMVGNIHVAEELMEETFVRLAVRRPHFRGRSSFKTWLYAIGRNLALDDLRRRRRESPADPELLAREADAETVEAAYLRDERSRALHRAMGRLHPEYRTVLWLVYFEEMDNAQAAVAMRKSKRQIENLIYRAKQSLRTELKKEGITGENL